MFRSRPPWIHGGSFCGTDIVCQEGIFGVITGEKDGFLAWNFGFEGKIADFAGNFMVI